MNTSLLRHSVRAASPRYLAARRVAGKRTFQRFQSTQSGGAAGPSVASLVAAGAAGGGVTLVGVYAFYHFSGAKVAVDSYKKTAQYYKETKESIAAKAPKSPNEALNLLRSTAQSYLVFIPGARPHVEAVFDTIDDLHDSHGDEVNRIVGDGYEDVRAIIKDSQSMDIGTAMKVLEVLRKRSAELEDLGKKAGSNALSSLSSKYPQVAEKLGSGYAELKTLAKSSPEAKKLYEDTAKEIHELFSRGFSQESVSRAQDLIQSKTSEIRKMAESSSEKVWDEAMKTYGQFLDKLPEVKQILSDNRDSFIASMAMTFGQGRGGLEEVFGKIKEAANGDIAKDKAKTKELVEYIRAKAHEAEEKGGQQLEQGWEGLQTWVRSMPGGEEAMKRVPDVKALVQLSREHGEDAKKLTRETYDDVMKVLEEKSRKAKELSQNAKEDAKKES